MIKVTATALIHSISPVMQVRENFSKRELVLDDSWERDGQRHPSFVSIEFTGDAMAQLDNYFIGQRVTVEAYVRGRQWNDRVINSIRGKSVAPAPTPTYPQQPMGAYPQQPAYQAAPMPGYATPAPQPTYPQQGYAYQQSQSPGRADLPFPS